MTSSNNCAQCSSECGCDASECVFVDVMSPPGWYFACREVDENGDGTLQFDEFCILLQKVRSHFCVLFGLKSSFMLFSVIVPDS